MEGEDYTETFTPVAKMTTIRCFLEIVASHDWEVHQMDVHNAFLHGDLEEEVYMQLPPSFRAEDQSKVCKFHKSLYGLKQTPRCWFAKLSKALIDNGFIQSVPDYSLFVYNQAGVQIHVLIYVDGLIIIGNSSKVISTFKNYFCTCFKMKDLKILKYFLGIKVAKVHQVYTCAKGSLLWILSLKQDCLELNLRRFQWIRITNSLVRLVRQSLTQKDIKDL